MVIRPYTDADLEAVLDVWYRASLVAHPFMTEKLLADEREQIVQQWLPMADTSVAERDDRLVGYLALVGNEVGAIFVDPELHRQGIGRALMDHARAQHPILELEVFEANALGRAFYAAYGFEPVGSSVHQPTGHTMLRLRLG